MKAKIATLALLCSALVAGNHALADQQTVSIGYAQSKVEDFKNLRGVNLQYRYEWDSPVSIIGSFSYLKGDQDFSERYTYGRNVYGYNGQAKVKYYSLMAGPAYRINDVVSLYGLVGVAHTKVDENVHYLGAYSESYGETNTSFAYGAGVVINPTETLAINAGYEGTRVKYNEMNYAINGFNIGIGYRF